MTLTSRKEERGVTHCTLPIHYRLEVSKCVGPYFSQQNLSSSGAIFLHYAEMVEAGPRLLGGCDAVLKERVGRGSGLRGRSRS